MTKLKLFSSSLSLSSLLASITTDVYFRHGSTDVLHPLSPSSLLNLGAEGLSASLNK